VPKLTQSLIGKLFGDRGYISKKLSQQVAERNIKRVTTLKKNMKNQYIDAFDKLMLGKRSIIETINAPLKNIFDLEHSRHRSLYNALANVVVCLVAFVSGKKPALNLRDADLLPFLANA
jgi:hypothetical protein